MFIENVKCHVFCIQTERDVSVRQRAVDLLYAMCDRTNAEEIVGEMLEYLESADYSIREEMVTMCFCTEFSTNKNQLFNSNIGIWNCAFVLESFPPIKID